MPVSYLQQPYLLRASKTFTGAANLGAVGDCPLFTTTGRCLLGGMAVYCATTLSDTVDGAQFNIGFTGATSAIFIQDTLDLDLIVAGSWLAGSDPGTVDVAEGQWFEPDSPFDANITMTVATQAITGGVLEFYVMYYPLSAGAGLSLGAGMVAI